MSDIRFNRWLHQSGTGGVSQDSSGRVGIGSSVPRTTLDVVGVVSATSFTGSLTGNVVGNVTGNLTGNVTGGITTTSIQVGDSFIRSNSIGIGTTTTAGRNVGVGTAVGTLIYNATENVLQVYTGTRWETGVTYQTYKATGGTVSLLPTNKVIHTFTSSGTFQIIDSNLSAVEVFMVGGGGGGGGGSTGSHYGGGGGSGALHYKSSHPVSSSPGTYSIVVGSGGASPGGTNTPGSKGANTTFDTLTCEGGGLGRGIGPATGGAGGSGGGAAFPGGAGGTGSGDPGGTNGATSPTNGWGNDGGSYVSGGQGGGGGGAGGLTSGPTNTIGGNGLVYAVSGISTTYASGGGGADYTSAYMLGANTGGGGNGGFPGASNAGQSGIVIIAYPS